jgi:hypothetical protein
MRLYHGTSESRAHKILSGQGIRPRGDNHTGHWVHTIESNPNAVYLTDAYAMHFAAEACASTDDRWAIFEVETTRLAEALLTPDEDFLEQATRGKDSLPVHWDMNRRTRYYRDEAREFAEKWALSLEHMGTLGYYGTIPVEAITRVSYFAPGKNPDAMMNMTGAQIMLANYAIVGTQYKAWTRWLFGGSVEPREVDNLLSFGLPEEGDHPMTKFAAKRREFLAAMLAGHAGVTIAEVAP